MDTMQICSSRNTCIGSRALGSRTHESVVGKRLRTAILLLMIASGKVLAQGVGISESAITPDANAILELRSTLRGFLAPRMTTAQRNTLGALPPSQGMLVYDTNLQKFYYWDSGTWNAIAAGTSVGTVTSFSAGTLSPLFTTSVATSTTTPALSFTLSNANAYTLFGNNSGASAAPAFFTPTLASALFQNQGTTTTVLHGDAAGNPSWSQIVNADITNGTIDLTTKVTGVLPLANGGTGATTKSAAFDALSPMSASGDLIYGGTSGTGTRLAKGTDGQVLTLATGLPSWQTPPTYGSVTSFSAGNLSPLFTTSVATANTTPALSFTLSNAGAYTLFGNNTGAGAAPTFFTPTLASALFQNQGTSTTVLHGNAAGNPSWSAIALGSDVSGTLPLANGGTGATTQSAAFDALSPMSTLGDLIYGGASGAGTRLAGNTTTTRYALTQTGTGAASAAPVWVPLGFSGVTVLTTASTSPYTVPADVSVIVVHLIGGGGGGAGGTTAANPSVAAGGGGGGGGYTMKRIATSGGASYTFVVGAGGAGGSTAVGTAGGQTQFDGTNITANGGSGGTNMASGITVATVAGGAGGTAGATGDVNLAGNEGGGGYRMSGTQGFSGTGGSSFFGTQSASVYAIGGTASNGNNGGLFGSGGSGGAAQRNSATARTATGGSGANGVIIIYEYK